MPNTIIDYKYLNLKSKLSIRFYVVFIMFLLWTLSQILIPIKFLPYEILSEIEFFKTTIPLGLVIVSTILYINRLKLHTFLWPFFAFSVFILSIGIFKYVFFTYSPGVLEDIVKYILWIISMFIVFPKIFNSLYKIRLFLRYSVILIFLFLTLSSIFFTYVGVDTMLFVSEERAELLYGNPLYFAGILYTLLCSSILLRFLSSSILERRLLLLLAVFSLFLIYMASARTFLLGSAVFLLAYYYNTNKNVKKISWVFILPLLFFIPIYINEIDINSVSSNRLFIWKEALSNEMNVWKLIFGNFDNVDYVKEMVLESGEIVVQTMQRYAVDNAYIEIFINTGLVGFFLFFLGLKNLLSKKIINQLGNSTEVKKLTRVFYIAYAVLISLLVSGLFYGHYPSFGNTLNSVLFPAVISIIFVFRNYIFDVRKMKIK